MKEVIQIDWEVIRLAYVMGRDYPSFDELAKRYKVSKPLIIEKANNREHPENMGSTWMEQRSRYIQRKQDMQTNLAQEEAKRSVAAIVKGMDGIIIRSLRIILRELDSIIKLQEEAIRDKKPIPITKAVKISDITRLAETMSKISGDKGAKELVVKLQVAEKQSRDIESLEDLTDEELQQLRNQIEFGADAVDTGFEVVDN